MRRVLAPVALLLLAACNRDPSIEVLTTADRANAKLGCAVPVGVEDPETCAANVGTFETQLQRELISSAECSGVSVLFAEHPPEPQAKWEVLVHGERWRLSVDHVDGGDWDSPASWTIVKLSAPGTFGHGTPRQVAAEVCRWLKNPGARVSTT